MGAIKFLETKTYKELSEIGANIMLDCVKKNPQAILCIATGASPTGTYKIFVEKAKEENIDTKGIRIVKLDEWLGVEKNDPSTCEMYIEENILAPLSIGHDRYISFNPMTMNPEAECRRVNAFLDNAGGIDICILGLGKNGHLGLNEPSIKLNPFPHVIALDEKTKTHEMLKNTERDVKMGITLGIANLLTSKEILFLVTGDEKKEAFNEFMDKDVRTTLPASFLWLHGNTTCVYNRF